ncbi:ACP S-malonyltransferase [Streptomyces sp. 15-116A]|uniref:ACP S-malonyltransferase n=1 Tax=Streptomyces sp. 15-116A TaxID=2259035 RepID=UPI0021B2E7C9|nr:ACP S-malonyltransferase [Streptomyces sp. 15-116A]MCT7355500.1 ACP S-malonyltransferase [Streptomyces sp. 15-116A]
MRAWLFPGQGAQRAGMGGELFDLFPEECAAADDVLGYSVRELCLHDPEGRLGRTRYAQPALFVVEALSLLARRRSEPEPDRYAGHSLGEFAALWAAGCFDFTTGVRLVRRRGELMGRADGGLMAAVLGVPAERVAEALAAAGGEAADAEIANHNSARQVVLSGTPGAVRAATGLLTGSLGARCVPLKVSAAFHSRHMADAAREFADYLRGFRFSEPRVPVVSNVTARPYRAGDLPELLARQVAAPVLWWQSMSHLVHEGVDEIAELGPGRVLTGLWQEAVREPAPRTPERADRARTPRSAGREPSAAVRGATVTEGRAAAGETAAADSRAATRGPAAAPDREEAPHPVIVSRVPVGAGPGELGSAAFRRAYGIRLAYLAGSMYRGISSVDLVVRLGEAGLMGFFGTGGLGLGEVEKAVGRIQERLGGSGRFGMNLLHDLDDQRRERETVELFLNRGVRYVEAAAFLGVTAPLVRFRFSGARRTADGRASGLRHVMAKVSRPEIATAFLSPPPPALLERMVRDGDLTAEEAELARRHPVAGEICVEADSGGHTDRAVALTVVPSLVRLRDRISARHAYAAPPPVGASGGLGSPEAVAAAFTLGADFVLTGSVNQCTAEAGTSDAVKEMLAGLDVQDTAYAPSGDMFELGARVQVVRKGTLFAARAGKLYELYRRHGSLAEIDERTLRSIERSYFRRGVDEVWDLTRAHYVETGRPHIVEKAEKDPHYRMALVFKWYFAHTNRLALAGDTTQRANFQIHCGPAMGAFNHLVRGTPLADWRRRHPDAIADLLMSGAARILGAPEEEPARHRSDRPT